MVGYYKLPELTAESFTSDGYFRTGDRGERRPDGLLRITGRVKELFKTAKGKYVAPAPIENFINEHEAIELSCVSGVGQPSAYAMVVLAEHLRPQMRDPAVRAELERTLTDWLAVVNRHVAEYERLQMFVVSAEPWSIESETLTPTMKIKRARIEALAAPHVDAWYAAGRPVLWQ
jgi:long-subunit acyl-CoA synthetase (AMP-forming)